jgi:branched-chain amino acid transport system substrate-binding protein
MLTRSLAAGWCVAVSLSMCTTSEAETLHVYSSLPLRGAASSQTADTVRGMQMALQQVGGRAGQFDVVFTSLDDSAAGQWDPARAARNALRAAQDHQTILYLGEFNSGASAVSIPILNDANVPQISPSNAYNGLTAHEAGTTRSEPGLYYPTGKRTFVRLPPRDTIQSAALLTLMRNDGCRRVTLADDGEVYGLSVSEGMRRQAHRVGVRIVRTIGNADHHKPAQVAGLVARARGDCFAFGGVSRNHAAEIFKAVGRRLPAARLYGPDGVCEPAFARRVTALAERVRCTVATFPVAEYPGGPGFLVSFGQLFGEQSPDPYAVYGYEAMKLGLDAIAGLGARGGSREAVRRALLSTRNRSSVLGTYSIDRRGDTTLRTYGVYRITASGGVEFDRVITAR